MSAGSQARRSGRNAAFANATTDDKIALCRYVDSYLRAEWMVAFREEQSNLEHNDRVEDEPNLERSAWVCGALSSIQLSENSLQELLEEVYDLITEKAVQ